MTNPPPNSFKFGNSKSLTPKFSNKLKVHQYNSIWKILIVENYYYLKLRNHQ